VKDSLCTKIQIDLFSCSNRTPTYYGRKDGVRTDRHTAVVNTALAQRRAGKNYM